ncbi:MAG: immune inhibitor A [Candidatus Cloacimonadaceae bacterium]
MPDLLKKLQCFTCLLMILTIAAAPCLLSAKVPPHPMYKNPPQLKPSRPSELFGPKALNKGRTLPQNVLALRVQFTDVTFRSVEAFPDYLPHDKAFFERWMLHLADFYAEASHADYILSFNVFDMVFNLSNIMSYYGADTADEYDIRVPQMLQELIQMADPYVDFSEYDAIVVFHAGAGQESDIGLLPSLNPMRPGTIWSTFITRRDLQAAFDPDNDNYQGIQTNDGTIIKEIVLVPEHEYQDYFPAPPHPDAEVYLFSIYGVLAHQFGHQIGLPTLFDNYSANGASQGIGNWGLMGTGLWNANGNVPAQLSAWSRYYLGWEIPQVINTDAENLTVDYFLNNSLTAQRLYKIPISAKEYFLVENRLQNPDNSMETVYDSADSTLSETRPSFTFVLIDPSDQDYYPPPNAHIPSFNFMENRYKGCEWDFFLPGLGGPIRPGEIMATDGSGLLIWHIDENIIESNFDPGFEYNYVNYDASHKGVDLEEADGIQHLDTATFDYYKYGGPFDSFRQGNNDYFGKGTILVPNTATPDTSDYVEVTHLPTSASYYGGIQLEIFDISSAGSIMNFSVKVDWKLDTGYEGINTLDACSVDFDNDGLKEIFYPMPDGSLYLWKDEALIDDLPDLERPIPGSYVWDGDSFYFSADAVSNIIAPAIKLVRWNSSQGLTNLFSKVQYYWATPTILANDKLVMGVDTSLASSTDSAIWIVDKDSGETLQEYDINGYLKGNLVWFRNKIYAIYKEHPSNTDRYKLKVMTPDVQETNDLTLPIPVDSTIVAASIAPIIPGSDGDLLIQTPYSIYLTDLLGNLKEGYPIALPFFSNTQVTISDIDKNGTLDYIVGGENSFAVFDYDGENMLTNFDGFSTTDSLNITSGVLAGDVDEDGRVEYIGAFSRNRLAVYEDNLRFKGGFPVSFSDRSRNMPFIHRASDGLVYAWLPTDNGKIFRAELPETALTGIDSLWYCRYGNLQRTSSRELDESQNQYETTELFVPGETYLFPNPVRTIYEQKLTFQIMTSRDALVEVSVFDITGKKLYRKNVFCMAYLRNRELVDFSVTKLASGVYIAVLKSGDTVKRIKFAIEK